MRALTVIPGQLSSATVEQVPDPPASDGTVLAEGLLMGVCGTDVEIAKSGYGWVPPGQNSLVVGHESLGRVLAAPADSGFSAGDLVVGVVRRPDPVPCPWCANNQWDMCSNGQYTERGIKERNGYGSSHWRAEPAFLVKVPAKLEHTGVLVEPMAVVAKAWEQIVKIGTRSTFAPRRALITGAGPIGLLAAVIGIQRGLEVHLLDVVADGLKPELARDLGVHYHHDGIDKLGFAPDIVLETTGNGGVILAAAQALSPNGILALVGLSESTGTSPAPIAALGKKLVLNNQVIFGSVNEAYRHYEQAGEFLASADQPWLQRLITRKVSMDTWTTALDHEPGDIKVVVDLQT